MGSRVASGLDGPTGLARQGSFEQASGLASMGTDWGRAARTALEAGTEAGKRSYFAAYEASGEASGRS